MFAEVEIEAVIALLEQAEASVFYEADIREAA
jgi:hypothetical protein